MVPNERPERLTPSWDIVVIVSATSAFDERPQDGRPLRPVASPGAIRAALLEEDRSRFDAAYESALAEARTSLDLSALFKTLEHWRRVALLQGDRDNYRRVVRRAAGLLTGEEIPTDEPLQVTRNRVGL